MKPTILLPHPILFVLAFVPLVWGRAATVAHYKFETTATNAPLLRLTDSSGNGHHGSVIGREPFEVTSDTPGKAHNSRTALDARGRDDYAIIPHHPDFAPAGNWTIEFFIKPTSFHQEPGGATNIAGSFTYLNTNLSYTILAKPNTNQPTRFGTAWAFHYQPARGSVVASISYGTDNGEILFAGKDLRDGEWHHIAMVFHTSIENEVRLFVDGFQTMSINQHGGNTPIPFGDGPIYVGAFSRQNEAFAEKDRNFDGFLDEVRFSDTALDSADFVGDFSWSAVQTEIFTALELRAPTEEGGLYLVEVQSVSSPDAWEPIASLLGNGEAKSLFVREEGARRQYRVRVDIEVDPAGPLPLEVFDAVEVRFQTENGQLYQITSIPELVVPLKGESAFVLGDGAKKSFHERTIDGQKRFYRVSRY